MSTENNVLNYPFEYYNPNKCDNHSKNLKLRQETALKDYNNSMKLREDSPMKIYKAPLAETLTCDLRNYTLEEIRNHRYSTKVENDYYVRAA